MKKKICLSAIAAVLVYASQVSAQQWSIGARGGLAIPNLTAGSGSAVNPLNKGYSSRLGLGFGVVAEYKTSRLFSIQAMLEYAQQGGKKSGSQAFAVPPQMAPLFGPQTPPYLHADFKSTAKLNYLLLPVLAKFGWDLGPAKK